MTEMTLRRMFEFDGCIDVIRNVSIRMISPTRRYDRCQVYAILQHRV